MRSNYEAECDDDSEDDSGLGMYVTDMGLNGAACWFWQLQGTKRYLSKAWPFTELRLEHVKSEDVKEFH